MRKIFTLVCAFCAVLSAFAEKSIKDNHTWSPWSPEMTIEATADGTSFTASDAWKGAGLWVATGEGEEQSGADWSDYDYLVYKVKDCSANFNICIEYTDNTITGGNLNLVATKTSGSIATGAKYAGLKLNEDYSDMVAQTWLQSTAASSSVVVTDLVLMTEDEFQKLKESEKSTETILWQGTQSFDMTWPGISGMGAALFADAKVGDKIVVTVSSIDQVDTWEYGAQLMWKNGASWQPLVGTATTSVAAAGEVELVLNDSTLAEVQTDGFVLQGMACTVTKIVLRAAGAASDTQVAWEGENVIGNWAGSFHIAATQFEGLQAGCKLIIDFKEDTENATYWQFKLNRGDTWDNENVLTSNAADLNEWYCATMGQGLEKYSFTLNEDDAAAIVAGGLRIQGYYVTVTKVSFSKATAIDAPQVERQDDGIMYNLIGQPVSEGYKGIVICNGKKFILK